MITDQTILIAFTTISYDTVIDFITIMNDFHDDSNNFQIILNTSKNIFKEFDDF